MIVSRTSACADLAVLLSGSSAAQAYRPSAFVARLVGQRPGSGNTFACFAQTYDAAHLASHPGQNVSFMEILVSHYHVGDQHGYQLRMAFRFKNRTEQLTTVAECGSKDPADADGAARCAGPSENHETELRLENRDALLVTLPPDIHLWKPGPPDPQHTVDDAFGPDDTLFRLGRAPPSACIDQAFEYEKRLPSRQP